MHVAGDSPVSNDKSETVSAVRDAAIGTAAKAAASVALVGGAFIELLAQNGIYEITAARIALERSHSEEVRRFARRMLEDHQRIDADFRSYLGGRNEPHSPPDQPDILHQVLLNDLHGASDENFDKRYAAQQVSAHEIARTLLSQYSKHGNDEAFRELASVALPVIEEHLKMARALASAHGA